MQDQDNKPSGVQESEHARDSKSGRFVSDEYAQENPETTQTETIRSYNLQKLANEFVGGQSPEWVTIHGEVVKEFAQFIEGRMSR